MKFLVTVSSLRVFIEETKFDIVSYYPRNNRRVREKTRTHINARGECVLRMES